MPLRQRQKVQKCCLASDEANRVTRIKTTQAAAQPPTVAEYVEHHLTWHNPLHQLVARHFVNQTIGVYEDDEIAQIATLWNDYANTEDPLTKKAGVYPATLEYVLCQVFGYEGTQNELAAKYDVSPGVISQRSNQILSFVARKSAEEESGLATAAASSHDSRIAMERSMREITALLEEQDFDSIDDANAFINGHLNSSQLGTRKRTPSKKEQAEELLYAAWEEPNEKKRIKMAQEALLLDPDSADAYNILAACDARTPAEMAYYYEQGMRAGARALGEAAAEHA